jgi:DNA topoisomerase-3
MLVKRDGKYGDFYGYLGFLVRGKEKCKVTFTIGENGEPILVEKKPVRYLENILCDKCGSKIIIRTSSRTGKEFGGCSKFPKCRNLYSMQGENIKKSKKITEEN